MAEPDPVHHEPASATSSPDPSTTSPGSTGTPAAGTPATGDADVPLLRTEGLTKHFHLGGLFSKSLLHAVDGLNITIREREIVALVGESGSGKSTVARLLAMVYRPTSGKISFRGKSVHDLRSRKDLLSYRRQVPMVFQDPYSSINPVFRVSHGVIRNLQLHRPELDRAGRQKELERLFEIVGLTPAREMLDKFPYEMSGGQRQRVGFAAALAVEPRLILADEPVSMLDVSIRAGVLNLMMDLRDRLGVSMLYITHDIASARYVADRIMVMYAGHVVETGPVEDVLSKPKHPYTQLLLAAVPDPREKTDFTTSAAIGEPPKVVDPAPGCRFRARCPLAIELCSRETPLLRPMAPGHEAACHVATPDAVTAPDQAATPDPVAPASGT